MTGRGLRNRLRRLHGERGFSLIETVMAITVIFGSLTALAYTATIGFDYTAISRERQTATGIATKIMEETRGIPYSDIQQGLRLSTLAADTNVVTGCGADPAGTYRFLQCTAGSNGTGDKIVYADGADAAPLADPANSYKHEGTITDRGISYTWKIYVTNNDTVSDPYRVTTMVEWTSTAKGGAQSYRTQSLFYSPEGCTGNDTHPFAAPCQPFFYGLATVDQPTINVSGSVEGMNFSSADIISVGVEANGQIEQTSSLTAAYSVTGITLDDGVGGAQTFEGTTSQVSADDDPTDGDQRNPPGLTLASGNGSFLEKYTGSTGYRVDDPSGETAAAAAVNNAAGANVCPPSPAVAETDSAPCAAARAQQSGTLTSVLHPHDIGPDVGDATIARIGAMSNPSTVLVDREGGTPPDDGRVEQSITRRIGTVNVGGLPPAMTAPANWSGANPWNGYFMTLVNYEDTATAQAGTTAVAPTAAVSAGTLYYWNGAGYSSISPTAAIPYRSLYLDDTIGGDYVEIFIETGAFTPAAASTASTPALPGPITRTNVQGTVTPPMRGPVTYQIWVDGVLVVNLTIDVNLGTTLAQGVYEAAP